MARHKKQSFIHIIAGCNGAGKTTFAREFLMKESKCPRFLNADEIARGLSPLDPPAGAMKAGRILLKEVHEAIEHYETFALETTLSGLTYVQILQGARRKNFRIKLTYLWISSPNLAIDRVRERVRKGGIAISNKDIRRRFDRSLTNLVRHYLPLADSWRILNNNGPVPRVIAEGHAGTVKVTDSATFDIINSKLNEKVGS